MMHLNDKLTIDGMRRTQDGYLAVSAKVARAGNVQLYSGAEVGKPHMSVVRVYRPEAEVFNQDTIKSFAHRPMTLGHPTSPVTADSWKSAARGWTGDEVLRDGDAIRVNMLLADGEAIRAVETGTRELSAGYDCELDWTPGTTPSGQAYDARQTRIRANHIAVVPQARGGSTLRIGDSAMEMQDTMNGRTTDEIIKMTIDEAAALPRYDWCRNRTESDGTPSPRHYAMLDINRVLPAGQRSLAAYDHMKETMQDAWKGKQAEQRDAPQFAKDGRAFADLSPSEQARERARLDAQDAWKAA